MFQGFHFIHNFSNCLSNSFKLNILKGFIVLKICREELLHPKLAFAHKFYIKVTFSK